MNQDSENFDSLRQLLALKRHEIPPPGYFDRLPRDIMARIKAGDNGDELGAEPSWFQRLLNVFDVKPVFAGAFGTAVCAFLISGFITSERTPAFAAGTPGQLDTMLAKVPEGTASPQETGASSNAIAASGDLFNSFPLHASTVSDRFFLPAGN